MGRVHPLPETDRDGRFRLATWLFIASWAVMFAALMVAYGILRARVPTWPPPGQPELPLALPGLSTAVLAASSLTFHGASRALRRARVAGALRFLGATLLLAGVFLALQGLVWVRLWTAGLDASGTYGGTFYMVSWFHAAHVLLTAGLLVWLYRGARTGRFHARHHVPVRMVEAFWHFLLGAWLVIYVGVFAL